MTSARTPTEQLPARATLLEFLRRVDRVRPQGDAAASASRRPPSWLRIEQPAQTRFAGCDAVEVQVEPTDFPEAVQRTVTVRHPHFGLFAPYGPLPVHITERALHERLFERNGALERFINLAAGDMAWLYYVSWSSMHPVLGYERGTNPYAERLGAFGGARPTTTRKGPEADHSEICRRAHPGLYCAPRRSLPSLRKMLTAYFGVPTSVRPRLGRWIAMPTAAPSIRNLGGWRLGSRIWDVQHSFEIAVGPIDADRFWEWKRGSPAIAAMAEIATDFGGGAVHAVIKVLIRTNPDIAGRVGHMRLGVDAWAHPRRALHVLTVFDALGNRK
jgi:type VI secretion system protein ImpH